MDNSKTETKIIQEKISGHVERITFHNADNGFCVVKIKARGHRDLVTVIGCAATIGVGEYVEASGIWINSVNYGLQFKAEHLKAIPPTTKEGIEKYLASGMIKGIGPYFARQLIRAFGEQVFDIIDQQPQRLTELPGIGNKRCEMILSSWAEQKAIRSIMVFLQAHGVGTARAVRIYKTYGDTAIDKVCENPYRLAQDIYGIGFKTADLLAQRLGIALDSMIRARAGVRYTLQEISNSGHCAALLTDLANQAGEILGIDEKTINEAINEEVMAKNLILEDDINGKLVYLAVFYNAEVAVAKNLSRLAIGKVPWGNIDSNKAIPWVEQHTGLTFSNSQKIAIQQVLCSKVTVITGGPGVGKTTIVNSIIKIIKAKNGKIALCAPTGRAAKRLSETTGLTAKTIHRLLRFDPLSRTFTHHTNNPLPVNFVVVDEASMIDIILMQSLLRAIPDHAALLIVGDVDQLPSVGPGNVLGDIIKSQTIPVVRLVEIFRQASHSRIIINAHRINSGEYPIYDKNDTTISDFYFIPCETPEEIQEKLLHIVTQRIPNKFGFDPIKDIQVLTPMNRSGLGSRSLNIVIQEKINCNSLPKINKFGWTFAPKDKVMQNVNNYDKDVFNGDLGIIDEIDLENSIVKINFDGVLVTYDFTELDEISLAYATSIHKSQGSEYPAVVIPLTTQHYMMLARNLIYTAVTRGKKLVVIIGQPKALAIAINNNKTLLRLTKLATRLRQFNVVQNDIPL